MTNKVVSTVFLVLLLFVVSLLGTAFSEVTQLENNWSAQIGIHIRSAATTSPTGLSPSQIKTAYNLPSTGGNGTVAIVDAFDNPTIQNDLINFSNQFGLPQANFTKHKMASTISVDANWALEIALDAEWVHAIAPNASILLVEARTSSLTDLLAAVDYATSYAGVVAVTMSWGSSEFSTENSSDSHFTSSSGIVFFASAGDSAGVEWPASSPNVVSVGGTSLTLNSDGTIANETVWNNSYGTTGGGVSAYENEPSYQLTYGISGSNGKRGVPDVSYDADPVSGFSVYDTTSVNGQTGWFQVGGTSAGAPQWAAIHSLYLSCSNSNFYKDAKSSASSSYFRDITNGSNGQFNATIGYDFVTGLGSPATANFSPTSSGVTPNAYLTVRGQDNSIYYRTYNTTTTSWTGWSSLPTGTTLDSPAAAYADKLYFVVRGSDGVSLWFSSVNLTGNTFSGWTPISGSTPSTPTLTSNGTYVALVVQGGDNRIYYRLYNVASQTWASWSALPTGTTLKSPAATLVGNTLNIVVTSLDNTALWYCNVNMDTQVFSGWTPVSGSTPSTPTLTSNGTALALVVQGGDNHIYYRYYSVTSQTWNSWNVILAGTTPVSPAATILQNALLVVAAGSDNSSLWQGSINMSTNAFSGWTSVSGSTPSKPLLTS